MIGRKEQTVAFSTGLTPLAAVVNRAVYFARNYKEGFMAKRARRAPRFWQGLILEGIAILAVIALVSAGRLHRFDSRSAEVNSDRTRRPSHAAASHLADHPASPTDASPPTALAEWYGALRDGWRTLAAPNAAEAQEYKLWPARNDWGHDER